MCQALLDGKEEPEKHRKHGGSTQKSVHEGTLYLQTIRRKMKVIFLIGKDATQAAHGENKQLQT
jgi:hypothetical protein